MNKENKIFIDAARNVIRAESPWKTHASSEFIHKTALPHATLAPWLSDEIFINTYNKIFHNTLVDIYRCYELWILAKQTALVVGDILEVGVWRGGTGVLLAEAIKNLSEKKVFLADTFKGVVKTGKNDPSYSGGEHSDTSIEIVQNLVNSLGLKNTELLAGTFPEDTSDRIPGKISLLHCDVDVYQSAKDIVEWSMSRLSIGSIIIFDDYGFSSCEGVTTYCNELSNNKFFKFIYNLNGHAIFIKIA